MLLYHSIGRKNPFYVTWHWSHSFLNGNFGVILTSLLWKVKIFGETLFVNILRWNRSINLKITNFQQFPGSCEAFRRLVKCRGKDVLYIGDHIFGDVLRSKKTRGWRTFLVVPELNRELSVWTERRTLFDKLRELDGLMVRVLEKFQELSMRKFLD